MHFWFPLSFQNPEGLGPAIDAMSIPPIFELLSFKRLLKN